ncbi:MAG: hypothetical protein UX53_C0013G0008 [Candidatus Azambacteria bacterium GW2011_GWB2_46_37]|uniref:Saccharopine dehydrogenase n=6 Tax=Candidatus Azamiibacteriota TaxID=1752741 RepID=A0A0G1TBI7_9BACT|nr:MAG: hypothetical protein UX27_C0005G0003 [Candidatus Azambacteria bacterium GW2011_GWA2_45_90]KKU21950.1 MAG: hypothetical protein UX33_C0018G0009 [Candidatus Azambacteria bacterium GW2011_GWC1_46_13]KKU36214.1 MAG: hypothetical protein UX48_C0010G0012 [Candidatus Azambacteria bacterium GW2011_GWB1_46_27]KKU37955.1 MAG: hypothetical protein UX51_C0009G0014 [Candidatus Azambacteria bacterium GW2011_GWF2_46_32]KKU39150.1 MAG: hypothetical protein UX53_C0013G0008 [Candidatus Azambacteria bacte
MTRVLIVGTGTIGQPLAKAALELKSQLGIDEIIILKNTPRVEDVGMVRRFQSCGAKICAYEEKFSQFVQFGMTPDYDFETALSLANVIIDCTKDDLALKMKEDFYFYRHHTQKCRGFIAQGGAKGFGIPFAYNINNKALYWSGSPHKFIQVVSCNTHNILAILQTLVLAHEGPDYLESGRFYLQRRVSDVSQKKGIIGIEVGTPSDPKFGSHQAADAMAVLRTISVRGDLDIHSRAHKSPNPYMHVIDFNLKLKTSLTLAEATARFWENPLTATTHQTMNNVVFSAGRDWGHFGRILNQTVVCLPSLEVLNGGREIEGTCFTPQDGNSLLSSFAALLYLLDGTENKSEWREKMKNIFHRPPFIFEEV